MTRTDQAPSDRPRTADRTPARATYSALIGLAALAVLLQGLWAGLFIREGKDYDQSWVSVHARGAEVAIVLAVVALVVLAVTLRERRDLLVGTAAFVVALVLESYVGGLVGDHASLTVVHIPLAMAIMGLAVWLPFRATRRVSS